MWVACLEGILWKSYRCLTETWMFSLDPVSSAISPRNISEICCLKTLYDSFRHSEHTMSLWHPAKVSFKKQSPPRMGTERTSSGNGTEDGFSPEKEHHILIVTKNTGWLGWQFASRVQGKKHKRSTKGSPWDFKQTKNNITYQRTYHGRYINVRSGSRCMKRFQIFHAPNRKS